MSRSIPAILALALLSTSAAPARIHIGAPQARTRTCISLHAIRDESAEDDGSLLFHVGGGRVYRNALPKPCEGLRSINDLGKLRLRPRHDGELCGGDTIAVEGSNPLAVVGLADSSNGERICTLGGFEPLTEMTLTESLRR